MKELKNKTIADLNKMISEKREILRNFRFGATHSKAKNVKLSRTTKKEIAQIMTEISLRSKVK